MSERATVVINEMHKVLSCEIVPAIEYQMVLFEPRWGIKRQSQWKWPLYAGQDGSILTRRGNPNEKVKWERLNQTWNENGYWYVTPPGGTGIQVQRLVGFAFHADTWHETLNTACHVDDIKDNNGPDNICWGDPVLNKQQFELNKQRRLTLGQQQELMKILLFYSGGTLRHRVFNTSNSDITDYLPRANKKRKKPRDHLKSLIAELVYRFQWYQKGVQGSLGIAMPEKTKRLFPGHIDGNRLCLPTSFEGLDGHVERRGLIFFRRLRATISWLPFRFRLTPDALAEWVFRHSKERIPGW